MRKLPFSRWRRYTTRDGGIDPSGQMLVAQHNLPVKMRDGDQIKTVIAGLSVLRIGDDGKLEFVRKYDIDVGEDDVVDGDGAAADVVLPLRKARGAG